MEHAQVVRAEVTTAVALPPDRLAALQQGARHARPAARCSSRPARRSVDHRRRVARIGSTVYDGSVTTQLREVVKRVGWSRARPGRVGRT